MKVLFDFFPVVAFFVTYIFFGRDIFLATAVIIVAVILQVGTLWVQHKKVSRMHLISAALVLLLGGITLLLKNDLFIKWKPTVVNWLFAAVFLGSQYVGSKSILERMLGHGVQLHPAQWRQLNLAWVGYFLFLGGLNLVVVYNFDEATWVKFKLFGLLGLTLAFALAQGFWIASKGQPEGSEAEEEN